MQEENLIPEYLCLSHLREVALVPTSFTGKICTRERLFLFLLITMYIRMRTTFKRFYVTVVAVSYTLGEARRYKLVKIERKRVTFRILL